MDRGIRLTELQQEALLWLIKTHHKRPGNGAGFNPPNRKIAAACRRMERRGLVQVNRMAPTHFRYSLTRAGYETWRASGIPLHDSQEAFDGQ